MAAVLGGAFLLLSAMAAYAQPPSQAGSLVYHLHGTVIDGSTGQPLARVLVSTEDRFLAAFTDINGHFSLEVALNAAAGSAAAAGARPAGSIRLTAVKPYFLAAEDTLEVALDENVSTRDLSFRLMPDAIITGRVTTPDSEGAADVRVDLLKHDVRDGRRAWTTVNVHATDSHGSFHFYGVEPGEYTVLTSAWAEGGFPSVSAALRSRPSFTAVGTMVAIQGPIPSASEGDIAGTDLGPLYPPTYLGDVRTQTAATVLHAQSAQQLEADVHLRAVPFFPVAVPVSVPQPAVVDPNGPSYEIQANLLSGDGFGARPLQFDSDSNELRGWLPSGTYQFLLTAGGPSAAYAPLSLHVDAAPLRTGPVTLVPSAPIAIHVRRELTQASLQQGEGAVSVQFRPDIDGQPEHGGATSSKAEFFAESVAPGQYHVVTSSAIGYVASVTSRGVDLQRDALVVGSGGVDPIEVTVRDDWGSLSGTVSKADATLPPGLLVAAVATETVDPQAIRVQRMEADGTFRFTQLPPGDYHVFACSKVPWNLPLRDSDTMQGLFAKTGSVQVKKGETADVTAPWLRPGDWEQP